MTFLFTYGLPLRLNLLSIAIRCTFPSSWRRSSNQGNFPSIPDSMKHLSAFLALPASLLSVVAAHAQELPWPHNLPRTAKYYPEDEVHIKREAEVQDRLAWEPPSGVRKMPDSEDEKFFLDYWGFSDDVDPWKGDSRLGGGGRLYAPETIEQYLNASITPSLRAAIAPHSKRSSGHFRLFGRNIFARDFQCPAGTHSCSSIGQDNLCCDAGETCISTSEGVGCCPAGGVCGNDVADCDTADGYTSCPNSPNGGCCIPGAVCKGVGCVFRGTETVTRTLATATETDVPSSTTPATRSISVTTTTVTLSPSGYTTTQTLIIDGSTTQSCKQGYFTCPASDGGGCCPNGQACAPNGECPDITTSTSASAQPPVLPTSVSVSPETVISSTTPPAGCPTGFYMCSARYLGGCCRVGRNCETTSCPSGDSTTLLRSGVTVVVTDGGNARATGGTCANGWFLCGVDKAGGCCPSGYVCGQVSCKATAAGQRNTLKMAPSSASVVRWAWSFLVLACSAGAGMLLL